MFSASRGLDCGHGSGVSPLASLLHRAEGPFHPLQPSARMGGTLRAELRGNQRIKLSRDTRYELHKNLS